jgi:hypothetical protein
MQPAAKTTFLVVYCLLLLSCDLAPTLPNGYEVEEGAYGYVITSPVPVEKPWPHMKGIRTTTSAVGPEVQTYEVKGALVYGKVGGNTNDDIPGFFAIDTKTHQIKRGLERNEMESLVSKWRENKESS